MLTEILFKIINESDTLEYKTKAQYRNSCGKMTLNFKDEEGALNRIEIENETVTVSRKKDIESNFTLKLNETTPYHIKTPYGCLEFLVYTTYLDISYDKIEAKYSLNPQESDTQNIHMLIKLML